MQPGDPLWTVQEVKETPHPSLLAFLKLKRHRLHQLVRSSPRFQEVLANGEGCVDEREKQAFSAG